MKAWHFDFRKCYTSLVNHIWEMWKADLISVSLSSSTWLSSERLVEKWIENVRKDRRESEWLSSFKLADAKAWAMGQLCQRHLQWLQNTCASLGAAAPLDKTLSGDERRLCVTGSLGADFASSVLLLIGLLTCLHTVPWPLSALIYCTKAETTAEDIKVMSMDFYCRAISIFSINNEILFEGKYIYKSCLI